MIGQSADIISPKNVSQSGNWRGLVQSGTPQTPVKRTEISTPTPYKKSETQGVLGLNNETLLIIGIAVLALIYFLKKKT
jgi:hypothetical protein